MKPTKYDDINKILEELINNLKSILGNNLVGIYLFGSLVWGDFDHNVSDLDLLTVTNNDLSDKEQSDLKQMHDNFAKLHPIWYGRIEVKYFSKRGLRTFKTQMNKISVISPGEDFHTFEIGKNYLLNWYHVQTYGITLYGPDPKTLIDPISHEEFIKANYAEGVEWGEYVKESKGNRNAQSYAVLTLCRILYAVTIGEQPSKVKAARWAITQIPEWKELINNALIWRQDLKNVGVNHEETYPEVEKFVLFVIEKLKNSKPIFS